MTQEISIENENLKTICVFIAGGTCGVVIFVLFLCLLAFLLIPSVSGHNMTEVSNSIYANSSNEKEFVQKINYFVDSEFIRTDMKNTFAVKSPEYFWETKTGDCSEFSLLKAEMLKYKGIDARMVSGLVPNLGNHDTVEIHLNQFYWFIDEKELPTFAKIYDGLHPMEYIINGEK